jgi:hypothetical protein
MTAPKVVRGNPDKIIQTSESVATDAIEFFIEQHPFARRFQVSASDNMLTISVSYERIENGTTRRLKSPGWNAWLFGSVSGCCILVDLHEFRIGDRGHALSLPFPSSPSSDIIP